MEQKMPLPNIPEPTEMFVNQTVNSSSFKKPFLVVLLVILLVILSSLGTYFFVKSQTSSQTPVVSPTPTPSASLIPSTANETANWKIYTNTKYGISFKHPDFDDKCCGIGGPITGDPESLVVLANKTWTQPQGTDKPFDGMALYILPNKNMESFETVLQTQKDSLIKNYKTMTDKEPTQNSEESIVIGGRTGKLLKGYAWWADIIYLPLPDNKQILVIAKTQASKNSFDSLFNQILSTFKFN